MMASAYGRETLQRAHAASIAVRSERSQIIRDLKAGRRRLSDLIADPPAALDKLPIVDLFVAAPSRGRIGTGRLLVRLNISAHSVGELDDEQRARLLAHVDGRVPA